LLFGQYFLQLFAKNQAILAIFCLCRDSANRGQSAYCYIWKILYKMLKKSIFKQIFEVLSSRFMVIFGNKKRAFG